MPPKRKATAPAVRDPKRTRVNASNESDSEVETRDSIPVAPLPRVKGKDIYDLPDEDDDDEDELVAVVKKAPAPRRKKVVTYGAKARGKKVEAVDDPQADELASMASPMVTRVVRKPTGVKGMTTRVATPKAPKIKAPAAKKKSVNGAKEVDDTLEENKDDEEGKATTKISTAPKNKTAPAKSADIDASKARMRAKIVETAEEEDEAGEKRDWGVMPETTGKSPEATNTKSVPAKTPKAKPRAKKVTVVEDEDRMEAEAEEHDEEKVEGVTPRTVVKLAKPPRTERKKGTSSAPRTRIQGKMGVGVPAGGEELTPSVKRSVMVPPPGDGEANEDEDLVLANGMIAPASVARPGTGRKKRPSGVRPSLGIEGLEDPFAVPKAVAVALGADRDEEEEEKAEEEEEEEEEEKAASPKVSSAAKSRTPKKDPVKPQKTSSKATADESTRLGEDIEVSADAVSVVQNYILSKIMGRKRLNLVGIDEEYSNVHHLLEQTVTAGEGNSMLIIGSRGSGKTTLVETALSSLMSTHSGDFYTVRLNGLLQTDDKLALREILRQLGVEMELEGEDQPKATNFADTLQSILAILSHPDELQAQNEESDDAPEDPAKTAVAVIFVLDEFDQFATHPRQTLLYNLFDIAQAKKAPIAVLGLTCKVDVVDSLEKRVKSRFSHRTVHLKLPASLDAFWDVVKEGLVMDVETATLHGRETERYAEAWSRYIDNLRETKEFTALIRSVYGSSKTVAPIFNAAMLALHTLSPATPFPAATAYTRALAPPASNLSLLPSLSDLQLALLISAARLEVLADTETVNFEMVYDEYLKLCTKTRAQATPSGGLGRVWSKSVAVGAWEGLEKMGLVVPVGNAAKRWRVDVGLMEIRDFVKGSQWVRWCKEVV